MRIAQHIQTKDIWGIEFDPDLQAECSQRGININSYDLSTRWNYDSNAFDILHASGIIDHLFDTDNFMEEAYRVTKPGGYFIMLNNNLCGWHHILTLVMGRQPAVAHISERGMMGTLGMDGVHWGLLGSQRLKRVFTTYGMMKMMEYYGFTVEKVKGVGWYPFPPQFARALCAVDKMHAAYFVIKARKKA